jgi:oxygen-independent coproporphyrinogen III oxidase
LSGIYIHIPFCAKRCVYCDFYFVTTTKDYLTFTQALCTEIALYGKQQEAKEPVKTIYFGGGTPSRLPAEYIDLIITQIGRYFDTSQVTEITFEANPDDLSLEYLKQLKDIGINRLSVGIQSFYQSDLDFMGRAHDSHQAEQVVDLIRRAGFDNFSVDLIFGVPNQPQEYWAANLEKVVRLDIPHLSCYGMTIEQGTPLFKQVRRGDVALCSDDEWNDAFSFTAEYLAQHGYESYEISNFAKEGRRGVHNSRYWEHENYLGFGPSAHSFWWYHKPGAKVYRWANVRSLKTYNDILLNQGTAPVDFKEQLSKKELIEEYLMLRLRTADGLNLETLEHVYGHDLLLKQADSLAHLETEALIYPIKGDLTLKLTLKGKMLHDAIAAELMDF